MRWTPRYLSKVCSTQNGLIPPTCRKGYACFVLPFPGKVDEWKVSSNKGHANGIVDVKGSRRSYELRAAADVAFLSRSTGFFPTVQRPSLHRETKAGNQELVLSIAKSGSCSKHLEQLYETSCEVGCPSLLASSCLEDEFQAAKRNEQLACIGSEIHLAVW